MCYSSRATATCLRALRDGVRPAWRGLGLCDGLTHQHLVAHVLGIRRLHKHLRADADLRRWRRGRWRHRRRWHAARADNAHMRLKTTSHSSVQYLWHQRQLKSVHVFVLNKTYIYRVCGWFICAFLTRTSLPDFESVYRCRYKSWRCSRLERLMTRQLVRPFFLKLTKHSILKATGYTYQNLVCQIKCNTTSTKRYTFASIGWTEFYISQNLTS